jgi:hypothetical protein
MHRIKGAMISDREIWPCAPLMLETHGGDAMLELQPSLRISNLA